MVSLVRIRVKYIEHDVYVNVFCTRIIFVYRILTVVMCVLQFGIEIIYLISGLCVFSKKVISLPDSSRSMSNKNRVFMCPRQAGVHGGAN